MGRSKSIEEKMADDKKFREFMEQIQTEAKREETRIADEMSVIVKNHYEKNQWDHSRLCGNKQSDYQSYDSWGLDRIIKIVESIGNALSAKDYPSAKVPGSEQAPKSTVDSAKEFAGSFEADYDLIIARVKALISGVLGQFSVASEAARRTSQRDMALAGGLHLFFGSSGSVYTQQTFFTNQFIGSFQIVFDVYMSVAEAKALGLVQILKTTQFEIDTLNSLIQTLRIAQQESLTKILKERPQDFVSTKAAYDVARDAIVLDRAKLIEEFDKYNSVTRTVDDNLHRIDLSEFKRKSINSNAVPLDHFFNPWETGVARRYLQEKLSA